MANYISIQYLRDNVPTLDLAQYSDTTISGMIGRASKMVDNFVEYSLDIEDIVDEKTSLVATSSGDIVVYPRKMPVESVSSLSMSYGVTQIDFSITQNGDSVLEIPASKDRVVYPYNAFALTGTLQLTSALDLRMLENATAVMSYRAGFTDIPEDIKEAVLLYLIDMFAKRVNVSDAHKITQGAISVEYSNNARGKSDKILDAETILMPYKRKF